ncbi:ATP-dependent Clp protease proteolytic subunit [Phototrophicus methaneseepsis]|uniref:ATP-dependent Clp protease proteolytic subunit n=1 Tax=Phototrophicus methaneseepsis TaxID=2710758 RepID=A0A7S8E821_9CHLR|nr:ATP-dependent Clp protease proteolytic subunit [Phototrophicus methaneseepsis]QPC82105.1 ATP-dependent Clp protease proteolytic subunit [Phototrophicus methaneseepsis]
MNDDEKKLLDEKKLIILHDDISHETYELIAYAVVNYPGEEITLWCRSDGGCSRSGQAIAELIKMHGHFVGVMVGDCFSIAVTIFAACQTRYIAQTASIGLHTISFRGDGVRFDALALKHSMEEMGEADRIQAHWLSAASEWAPGTWLKIIESAAHSTCKMMKAEELTEIGFAKPMEDYHYERENHEEEGPVRGI